MAAMMRNGETANSIKNIDKYTNKFVSDEVDPLTKNDKNNSNKQINVDMTEDDDDDESKDIPEQKKTGYNRILERYDVSNKSKRPFCFLIIFIIILMIIIIFLAAFWPRIPDYMTAEICTDDECFQAGSQILSWTNSSIDICEDPYEWACGNFKSEYENHDFFDKNPGHFNFDSYMEYEDVASINDFITKLPPVDLSHSAQLILIELHASCMNIDTIRNAESIAPLKTAIVNTLHGWVYQEMFGNRPIWSNSNWDFRSILPKLSSLHRVSPFFKISVGPRNSPPYGNIITISEGELGLPHKKFYSFEHNHYIVTEYLVLLRDIAVTLGVTAERAKLFSEEIFSYEKRIVNSILAADRNETNLFMSLEEVQRAAPSLPILETVRSILQNTQITEKTVVLVQNFRVLQAMSIIVSSSDSEVLNNFLAWSLIRSFLPYLPKEFRSTLDNFKYQLYDYKMPQPTWYFCSNLIKQWAPLALRTLQENPQFIKPQQTSDSSIEDPINYEQELAKIIFYHVKTIVLKSISDAEWINADLASHITDKLSTVKIQMGIPSGAASIEYLEHYYQDYYLQKFFFVHQLESQWTFEKKIMTQSLVSRNETDKILDVLFPFTPDKKRVRYSLDLNMIVVVPDALMTPYFHHKYPISLNFARLGSDFAETLFDAAYLIGEQYKEMIENSENVPSSIVPYGNDLVGEGFNCTDAKVHNSSQIALSIKMKIFSKVSASNMALTSLKLFISNVDNDEPLDDSLVADGVTYDMFEFKSQKRLPALRMYDELQLFTLNHLQRHCTVSKKEFKLIRPFIEDEISEEDMFRFIWRETREISETMECTPNKHRCENML